MSSGLPKVTEEMEQLSFEPTQPDAMAWGSEHYVLCAYAFPTELTS